MSVTYDRLLHGVPELDEIDGWTVMAEVTARDGTRWHYQLDVTKELIEHMGWFGVRVVFDGVQARLTSSAGPCDVTTIEWSCRPWWWPEFGEDA